MGTPDVKFLKNFGDQNYGHIFKPDNHILDDICITCLNFEKNLHQTFDHNICALIQYM